MRLACERGLARGKGSEQTLQKVRAPMEGSPQVRGDTTWACSVNGGGGSGERMGVDPDVEK